MDIIFKSGANFKKFLVENKLTFEISKFGQKESKISKFLIFYASSKQL